MTRHDPTTKANLERLAAEALSNARKYAVDGDLRSAAMEYEMASELFRDLDDRVQEDRERRNAEKCRKVIADFTETALEAFDLGLAEHARRNYAAAASYFGTAAHGFILAGDTIGAKEATLAAEDAAARTV